MLVKLDSSFCCIFVDLAQLMLMDVMPDHVFPKDIFLVLHALNSFAYMLKVLLKSCDTKCAQQRQNLVEEVQSLEL